MAPETSPLSGRKTLLFADVHANLPALQAVLKEARQLGVDSYLFLGDAVGYGPHPSEVLSVMRDLPSALLIQGNHDHAVAASDTEGMNRLAMECIQWTAAQLSAEELDFLATLPVQYAEDTWMALHGAPIDPVKFNAYIYETTYRENLSAVEEAKKVICFFGHTHVPGFYRRAGTADERIVRPKHVAIAPDCHYLINPGSVGQPRDGIAKASFAIWDRVAGEVSYHRIPYPLDLTLAALKKAGMHPDLGYRLELGR